MNRRVGTGRTAALLAGAVLSAGLVACDSSRTSPAATDLATSSQMPPADPCAGSTPADLTSIGVVVDDQERAAVVHVPRVDHDENGLPVVLGFHGFGGTTDDFEGDTGLVATGDAEGFVTVFPAALGNPSRWDVRDPESPDLAFVDALLDDLEARICIDRNRIYATGFSQGATMASAVGCSRPDRFAAIAPVAGTYGPMWRDICAGEPVPVIGFHGVLDPVVPYHGGTDAGGRPVIGADQWATEWADMNACMAGPEAQPSIGDVQPLFWTGCTAAVEFYRVTGAGHSWPGGPHDDPEMGGSTEAVSANDLIWSFFERHSLDG